MMYAKLTLCTEDFEKKQYYIEVLRTKDNLLTSFDCYSTWASLSRIKKLMPSCDTIERTSSIITQAIIDQFNIKNMGSYMYSNLREGLRLMVLQAHTQLLNTEGISMYNAFICII